MAGQRNSPSVGSMFFGVRVRFLLDKRGVSSVEYALLVLAILLVAAGAYRLLGKQGATAANKAEATLLGQNPTSNPGNGGAGGGLAGGGDVVCDGRSCGAPGQCFVAGTLVATPSGERPIESLKAGDIVLARGEADGAVAARPIVHTFARLAPRLVDVHMIDVDGARDRVRSTPEHLYFTRDRGWLGAGDLLAGETLADRAGREVQVTKVVPIAQEAIVYNLEVERDHTYFVGRSSVWVHNLPCGPGGNLPPSGPAPPTVATGAVTGVVTGPVLGSNGTGAAGSLNNIAQTEFQNSVNTVAGSDFAGYMQSAQNAQTQAQQNIQNAQANGQPPRPQDVAVANMPTYQLAGVIGYTSNDYWVLNGALRSGDPARIGPLRPYIDAASQGLSKLPDYQGPVFRGTALTPAQLAPYQVGSVVQEPAFTSTSHNSSVATGFQASSAPPGATPVIYFIQSKNGKKVAEYSQFPNENEVLFPPGTKFEVLQRQDVNGVTEIYMKEV